MLLNSIQTNGLLALRLTRFAATVANIVFAPSAAPPFADGSIHAAFSPVGALTTFRIVFGIL